MCCSFLKPQLEDLMEHVQQDKHIRFYFQGEQEICDVNEDLNMHDIASTVAHWAGCDEGNACSHVT